ncbi:hypothetical protein PG993_008791 [Apiospora rasikravindrae]|uniref:Uncharacterized protein n=1 Tax=Apiospora rasikravindrae TaxID=990691 RepID=A0ABR1SPF7_9PEZI
MSAFDLKGKIAIVTGAGSGINHALTELLLEAGCSVVMADLRLKPAAQATLERHQRSGNESGDRPSAVFQPTDMSDWAQIRALWEAALRTYGRVNIVVNGAGIFEPRWSTFWNLPGGGTSSSSFSESGAPAEDDPDGALGQYKTLAINTMGPIRLAQIAVAYWLEHHEVEGNLLWFASLAGYLHGMLTPLYFASKAAIVSMAKSLGGLRESCGIRNSCICPGTVHSPMIDEDQKHLNIPPDEIGLTPKECAEVALRLLQEPQYGDGNIVECLKVEDGRGERVTRLREVPLEALYPDVQGGEIGSILAEHEKRFKQRLGQTGMRGRFEE